jgi:glycosyltransferase involved in cell wall biosynthesis
MTAPAAEPIRITHCIGSMRRGGAEGQLAELIARLPPEQFRQSLVLLQGGGPLLDRVSSSGCEVVELGYVMRYRRFDPRFYLALGGTLLRFIRHLRRFRPHIVHGWLFWANIIAVVAARLSGVGIVVTSRLQLGLFKDQRRYHQFIENVCNRFTTRVLANAEAVRRDALAREVLEVDRTIVVYNGVDVDGYASGDRASARTDLGLRDDDVVALVLANLHPYKGHSDVIEAMKVMGGFSPQLKCVFAGRDAGEETRLRISVEQAGLSSRIVFAGERGDVPQCLAASDMLVHPSRQEGFPNAILEAMAAGKPVVAYDVGGCREAVIHNETGLLVAANDVDGLSAAMQRLYADPELRLRLGRAGAERARTRFSISRMIERMQHFYTGLAAPRPPEAH